MTDSLDHKENGPSLQISFNSPVPAVYKSISDSLAQQPRFEIVEEEASSKQSVYRSIKEQVREVFISKDELYKRVAKGLTTVLQEREERLKMRQ